MHPAQTDSGIETRSRSVWTGGQRRASNGCMLVPVCRVSDIDAALAFALSSDATRAIHLAFLHVMSLPEAQSSSGAAEFAERLLDHAEARCRAEAIPHDSYVLAGDLVFSILDAAELLACDAIVMARPKARPWHRVFQTNIVRNVTALCRDVPLILIDENGKVTRSERR